MRMILLCGVPQYNSQITNAELFGAGHRFMYFFLVSGFRNVLVLVKTKFVNAVTSASGRFTPAALALMTLSVTTSLSHIHVLRDAKASCLSKPVGPKSC